jgi:putative ABC transport system permease protein
MNLVTIAWKSIRQRALASSLTGLSVALGVMLVVAVLVTHGILDRVFSQKSIGYSLIIGPKGSDLQLVLNTVYRVWQPIENLPYRYYQQIKEHKAVTEAVPFCLGDVTEQGAFPIVGTNGRYFELEYAPDSKFMMKEGVGFTDSFDAIIGSQVAKTNGWDIGSTFKLVHGGAESDHVHDEIFTVRDVLAPTGTPNDKTVFIHLDGFYAIAGHEKPPEEVLKRLKDFYSNDPEIQQLTVADLGEHDHSHDHGSEGEHDHHHHHATSDLMKEVTAILVVTRSQPASVFLSNELKKGFQAQAVNPVTAMSRLMNLFVGSARQLLLFLTGMIVVVSGVSIFVSIYNSMADRKREIAIMRALGASRQTVFSIILVESVLLCVGGGILGILLGHGLVFAAAPVIAERTGLLINPLAFEKIELVLIPVLIVLASLIGFVPGMTAYRTDVAKTLSA